MEAKTTRQGVNIASVFTSYAKKFSGKYEHRSITGGIGHNLPQEAPESFAQAIIDVSKI